MAVLAGPNYRAVVDKVGPATGKDGRYVVRWSDAADIGSPGFGLLDELERHSGWTSRPTSTSMSR